nr:hypothetical protein [Tanacetum cinerariifolium]
MSYTAGTQDATSQEVKKNVSFLRYIALPNWAHDALLEFSSSKPQDHCSTEVLEGSGNLNPTDSTSNPPADQMETLTVEAPIPTISDALQDPSWVEAMQEELLKFKIQNVWTLVDCPKGVRPIGTKWVLKNKQDERGIVIRNKARLVAQGGTIDQTLFIRRQRGDYILVQVYMDDIIFGSSNPQLCREFKAFMHEKFQMSAMGELNFFFGLQVLQKEDGIFLSQDKYVGDILKKFRYSNVRSSNTPMDKENPWGKDETGKDVDLHLYRSMIGSLMYLTASRPDIMFAVCAYARHQVTPKECHLHAVKRIFRYLKGYPKLGLCMPCEALSKEILSSVLRLLHTAKTFDLVWIWLGGDYGNAFLMGFNGIQCNTIMARLQFCDYHNMVAILEKSEHNADFHPMVDFIEASPLRINLKLQDEEGISSLPYTELFKNLCLGMVAHVIRQEATGPRNRVVPNRKHKEKPRPNEGVKKLFIKKQHQREILKLDPSDHVSTSVMIRNIPNNYTRELLVKFLEDHCKTQNKMVGNDEKSAFDFVYLPIDF